MNQSSINLLTTSLPPIVSAFARFLGNGSAHAEMAAALAVLATQAGHVCADLDQAAGWGPWADELDEAARADFRVGLGELACVGGATEWTPLVWDGRRLYLRRYFEYERRVAEDLAARAALGGLELISGGPGTGKTTSLARRIEALRATRVNPRIALAAPTGKAAARMGEALLAAGVGIDGGARTLHRLLGQRADGSGFRHDRKRPLAVDVLVVDEASMVDLALMAHLLDALPPTARLMLLGDRDQLAAVEAGAVFADLCDSSRLANALTRLTHSYRFGADSGIGQLAGYLRAGDAANALARLHSEAGDIALAQGDLRALIEAARAGYDDFRRGVAAGLDVPSLFARFDAFRVLCAHRQDAAAINRALTQPGMTGTPLLVTRNDPLLRVFNGDVGLLLPDPADGQLKACFPGAPLHWVALQRLPAWEPAWAMTVHKAQGSEFARVLLALPAGDSPVATRELVYTGITRAKQAATLWADEGVLRAAVGRRAERMSGLRDRLDASARPCADSRVSG